ncbi:MAG: ankyrin repeat domain-containing protein [Akkermansia sp.]|nr:ankyrin repeat domain-containing protein [Akkermansia sp.]
MNAKVVSAVVLGCVAVVVALLWPRQDVYEAGAMRWWYQDGSGYVIEVMWDKLTPQNVNESGLMSSETGLHTYTPLQHAITEGNEEGVRQCLKLGAATEKRVESMHHERLPGSDIYQGMVGYTPLHLAVFLKQYRIVELLLEAGADMEGRVGSDGSTPLMRAAYWGDAEMVRLLLSRGADAQAVTGGEWCFETMYQGKTAAEMARERGHAACVELLQNK